MAASLPELLRDVRGERGEQRDVGLDRLLIDTALSLRDLHHLVVVFHKLGNDGVERELEEAQLNQLQMLYMLAKERQFILADPIYRYVEGQFEQYGGLNKAYHAMLRCSPFGFPAEKYKGKDEAATASSSAAAASPMPPLESPTLSSPAQEGTANFDLHGESSAFDLSALPGTPAFSPAPAAVSTPEPARDAEEKKEPQGTRLPTPHHIDRLAAWILAVAGCIPAAKTAQLFREDDREEVGIVKDYCITRPQIRCQAPLQSAREEEAMARHVLFEDPGELDRAVVSARNDNWAQKLIAEARCRTAPNGNIPKDETRRPACPR